MVGISTDVAGHRRAIEVQRQPGRSRQGQVLFRLKQDSFRIALERRARRSSARCATRSSNAEGELPAVAGQIAQAEADIPFYETELQAPAGPRRRAPSRRRPPIDQAKHDLDGAQQKVDVAKAQVAGNARPARRQCRTSRSRKTRSTCRPSPASTMPSASSTTRSSRRRSTASSPTCRALQVGPTSQAAQQAFSLVSTDHVWVAASPKETELTYVEPGQTVDDLLSTPIRASSWKGTVDSISPASGSELLAAAGAEHHAATGSRSSSASRCASSIDDARRQAAAARRHERDRRRRYRPCARPAGSSSTDLSARARAETAMTSAAAAPATPVRQSRRDHGLRHPRRHHAGARHDDRQCRAALYPGQRLGQRRPDQLGPDLLHRRRGDHDAAVRLPGQPVRAQARAARRRSSASSSPRSCAALAQSLPQIVALPPDAGPVRRGAGAAVAGHPARHLHARGARLGDGAVRRLGDGRAGARPGDRRLADRQHLLALGLLHQPADRRCWPSPASRSSSRRPSATRGAKLDWFGFGTLSVAIGSLQLFLDRGEQLDWFSSGEIIVEATICAAALLPLPGPHLHGREILRQSAAVPRPQFLASA